MTAPLPRFGACCASGDVRRDPWTGDERCLHCGLPVPLPNVAGAALHGEESPPPAFMGGQGRDASEVIDDGDGIVRFLVIAGFVFAIVAGGVWAAGGGR
jgi:hypothetical protein